MDEYKMLMFDDKYDKDNEDNSEQQFFFLFFLYDALLSFKAYDKF